ncbi:hypothetical protein C0993_009783 [Termitomyces sp. T159_Od127]|nr:hypothetical protein C0993_009783 [Termitomyces sp. T159_Od127]
MQHKEPIKPQNPVPTLVLHQQEELNAASNILKALNPIRGLFNQPTACTIGLSACPHANSLLSTFRTWRQPADANPHSDAPPCLLSADNDHASTHTLFYINELKASGSRLAPPSGAPPSGAPTPEFQCDHSPHFDLCHLHGNALPLCNNPPPLHQLAASGAP